MRRFTEYVGMAAMLSAVTDSPGAGEAGATEASPEGPFRSTDPFDPANNPYRPMGLCPDDGAASDGLFEILDEEAIDLADFVAGEMIF